MGNTNDVVSFDDARNKMKTIEYPKYQYIEYPIKEWVYFSDMGDGRCRLYYKLPIGTGRNMTQKMWKDLENQLDKFIEEDGRYKITSKSYFDEYSLPMIVFPKNRKRFAKTGGV